MGGSAAKIQCTVTRRSLGSERWIKSVRTEYLDHLFIIGEVIYAEPVRRISHISTVGTP
jgi:hypothetical protein